MNKPFNLLAGNPARFAGVTLAALALACAASIQAQNQAARGKPINPKSTVIIDYEDGVQEKSDQRAKSSGASTASAPDHSAGHFELWGGKWADSIADNGAVDPNLHFVVDLRGFPAGSDQAILAAFAAWEVVTQGALIDGNSSFGPVAADPRWDGINSYSMRNLGKSTILAATFMIWDDADNNGAINNGETFLEVDVIHNSTVKWGTSSYKPSGTNWQDVQNVATHEIGHVFGLAHPSGHPEDAEQTMYASSAPRETKKRTLEANGDIPGIQSSFLGYGAP
ncbi:MAG: matrixin family metalloprotease [Verrucomicrobia bacterium]|nr:matrixin family metalloprotease [Verrucomicrobiota bacterium]